MIEVWRRAELEKLMRKHRIQLSKSLGQNFLMDRNILEKIVDAAGLSPEDHVVEVGAGVGGLTVLLAQAAGRVTAVELDRRLVPALEEATEGLSNVEIDNEDFLKYDLAKAARRGGDGAYKVVGNLPYYITTPIIAKLFEKDGGGAPPPVTLPASPPALAVLMVQKEVADRLLSPPGKKTYGAISVLVQYYAEAEPLFPVSREVFFPKPQVDSAVIRLTPRDISADESAITEHMFRLVRAGFDQRRKTLRNSLAAVGHPEPILLVALEKAGIDPIRRAETLSPRDFYALASHLM